MPHELERLSGTLLAALEFEREAAALEAALLQPLLHVRSCRYQQGGQQVNGFVCNQAAALSRQQPSCSNLHQKYTQRKSVQHQG
jgi:hypothetical protein